MFHFLLARLLPFQFFEHLRRSSAVSAMSVPEPSMPPPTTGPSRRRPRPPEGTPPAGPPPATPVPLERRVEVLEHKIRELINVVKGVVDYMLSQRRDEDAPERQQREPDDIGRKRRRLNRLLEGLDLERD